jgi:hypothetical protein
MKRPSLKADDGAEFVRNTQRIEDGRFQASCHAMDGEKTEESEIHICASEEEAKKLACRTP